MVISCVYESLNKTINVYILSNNRNLTIVNLSVFLEYQQFLKHEVHTNILGYETVKLFFFLNSGEKLKHLNNWKRKLVLEDRGPFSEKNEN